MDKSLKDAIRGMSAPATYRRSGVTYLGDSPELEREFLSAVCAALPPEPLWRRAQSRCVDPPLPAPKWEESLQAWIVAEWTPEGAVHWYIRGDSPDTVNLDRAVAALHLQRVGKKP